MHINHVFKVILALGLTTSLSACLGSSGGDVGLTGVTSTGGATTGGTTTGSTTGGTTTGNTTAAATALTPAEFDAKNLEYIFLPSTTTPVTGSAEYVGRISALTGANAANSTEAVYGDLNLTVNFDAGATNPITGTAGNFAGLVDGVQTTVVGTLSTDNAIAGDVNAVETGTAPLTGITATLRGDLSDPSGELTGNARMILSGNLKGDNGAAISGGHQTTISAPNQDDVATGGSFFADKQ